MITLSVRFLVLALGLFLLIPAEVRAQPSDVSQAIAIEVIPGWRRDDGTHVAGLQVRLAPGWKTYWRSAGAAGISPQMDWRGSRNLRSVTPAWPTPTVFRTGGAISIGYDEDFVLPLVVSAGPGPVDLEGVLDIGVCADICLPARLTVSARLDPGAPRDPRLVRALDDRPRKVAAAARCRISPIADGFAITGLIDVPSQGRQEAVVFEPGDPALWVTDAQVRRTGGRIEAQAQMFTSGSAGAALNRSRMRITVIGERGAVEVNGCTG